MSQIAAVSVINAEGYVAHVYAGRHALVVDEPPSAGGADSGPSPQVLLLAALASCTAIRLRTYAEAQGWPLRDVHVRLRIMHDEGGDRVERVLAIDGPLDDEQRARLLEAADDTPVTRYVRDGLAVATSLR